MYFCIDADKCIASGETLQKCLEDACLEDAEEGGMQIYGNDDETVLDPGLKFYKAEQIQVTLTPSKRIPAKLVEVKKPAAKKSR